MDIKRVIAGDDVRAICAQTGPGNWAADNEMKRYDEATLQKFLQNGMNYSIPTRIFAAKEWRRS